MQYNVIG